MLDQILIAQDTQGRTTVTIPAFRRTYVLPPDSHMEVQIVGRISMLSKVDVEEVEYNRGRSFSTVIG